MRVVASLQRPSLSFYGASMGMTPYRATVQSLFLKGYTYAEIARETNTSLETVKVTIWKMRRQGYGLPYRILVRG